MVINGITNYLYPTFDDLDSALVKLKSKIPDYYRLVEKQVDLTEAYDRLYTEYQPGDFQVDVEQAVEEMVLAAQNTVGSSLQSTSQIKKLKEDTLEKLLAEKAEFDRFLDIYENKSHLQGYHKEKPPEMDGFNYFRYSPRPEGGSLGYSSSSKLSNGPLRPERWSLVYSTFSSTPLSISFLACAEGSAE